MLKRPVYLGRECLKDFPGSIINIITFGHDAVSLSNMTSAGQCFAKFVVDLLKR